MAGFGGAVKLTGESEYRRALNQITQNLKEVASEMRVVSTGFDQNDHSARAMSARAEVLNKTLAEQQKRLSLLTAEYEKLAPKVAEEAQKHQELVSQYQVEKAKLDTLKATLGETSSEYKAQLSVVEGLSQAVAKSRSANDANEKSLSNLRIQMNNTDAEINKTQKDIDNLGKETENSGKKAEEASKGYTVFKNILANLATQGINLVLSGIKNLTGALVNVGKQAVASFAQFEQLEGGVKKIFGEESAQMVMENAQKAFRTAGMSANTYMETVTNFSARLIQGLGGDTATAVEIADRAMQDMSDNANTYGTNIQSIMNAYQGFSKQNYTMLDNLKLGYGGTKKEMERLIADASTYTEIQKELGIEVKKGDMSFANIANAISVVQSHLGIMGTTAHEASNTIEGSTKAMKASWQNLLTGMAQDNADFGQLVDDFLSTLVDENGGGLIPVMKERIKKVIEGIGQMITTLIPQLTDMIVPLIQDMTPTLVTAVTEVLRSIVDLLPTILPFIAELIPEICRTLIEMLPEIVDVGVDFIISLIDGISDMLPELLTMCAEIVIKIGKALLDKLPEMLNAGLKLVGGLVAGLVGAIWKVGEAVVKIGKAIWGALKERVSEMASAGKDLVAGLWNGISNSFTWIKNKIRGWVGDVLKFIKKLFGIASPSKVFRDQIGANLALGIGEGFSEEMDDVSREMADSIPRSFDVSPVITGARYGSERAEVDMVSAFKEALAQMKIVLDDEVAGRFVETTVVRAVYAYS